MRCSESYRVKESDDGQWVVRQSVIDDDGDSIYLGEVFRGSISDCEAYVRLQEKGLIVQ